ncbi:MAG: hypothetical protein VX777_10170 [Chlamydiota bacterium]|nr:hypothetical protein [Chlamydiota bacterium]
MERALSSKFISVIVNWRNPDRTIGYWQLAGQQHPKFKYKLAAECCFFLTLGASVIETIVSSIFYTLSLPLDFITLNKPLDFAAKWLKSSSFSILWSIGNLYFNLFYPVLIKEEDMSRAYAFGS